MDLPEQFFYKNWTHHFTTSNRKVILKNQNLSINFLRNLWDALNFQEKNIHNSLYLSYITHLRQLILKYQNLPMNFIKIKWHEIHKTNRETILMYQDLTLDFIKLIWYDVNDYQKEIIRRKIYNYNLSLQQVLFFI